MIRTILTLIASLCLFACDDNPGRQSTAIVLNEDIAKAMQNYASAYSRKRSPLEFQSGITANNCAEYIEASRNSALREDLLNQANKSEYLECDVLSLLGDTPFSLNADGTSIGEQLAARLDLRTFSSSLYQRLEDNAYTLMQLANESLAISSHAVTLESNMWYYRLSIVAIADVNQDGKQDWILWVIDEAKEGNYRNYQTLVIYSPDQSQNSLKADVYPISQAGQ